jgi:uncharacterized protein YabN with tetrapyrrole methylase and pyrophosphatase domain
MENKQGSLVCVGPGMTLGAHISIRCKAHIQQADVVFTSCHPIMEQWLQTMHTDVRSLQGLYGETKDRRDTYKEMQLQIMDEVRLGKKVVGVFYGHPGVFAQVPHHTITQAREEGFHAHMEPGISAEDCLYADMGVDPGAYGCMHLEASQFMFYQRKIDNTAYLILWQVGLAGDTSLCMKQSNPRQKALLVEMLLEHYPAEHNVALYECPFLMTDKTRIDWIELQSLGTASMSAITTLVIPPAKRLVPNKIIYNQLKLLE